MSSGMEAKLEMRDGRTIAGTVTRVDVVERELVVAGSADRFDPVVDLDDVEGGWIEVELRGGVERRDVDEFVADRLRDMIRELATGGGDG